MSPLGSLNYTFEKLGEGIHAALARPDGHGICNSGLIDLGGDTLVFDTSLTPSSARELRGAAEVILGHFPSLAVNSHWHLDHTLGNPVFAAAPIWGTRRTREILLEKHDQLMAELTREGLEKDLRELEGKRATKQSEGAHDDLEFILRINRALLAEVEELQIAPPDYLFEDQLTLPGRRGARLLSFGSGHTEADALLFLPEESVVFAGDLVVVGLQPSMGSGDPYHWPLVLDQIERMNPEHIVPGHGPVVNREGMQEVRDYLSGIVTAAGAPAGAPLPRALRRWEGSLTLEENLTFTRRWIAVRDTRK